MQFDYTAVDDDVVRRYPGQSVCPGECAGFVVVCDAGGIFLRDKRSEGADRVQTGCASEVRYDFRGTASLEYSVLARSGGGPGSGVYPPPRRDAGL